MPLACVCDNGVDQVDFAADHLILLVTVWAAQNIQSPLYCSSSGEGGNNFQNNQEQLFLHTFCGDDYLVCIL